MTKLVRTRIAPSPTGFPHIGTIFQALINYAVAKNANGQFIVRIEDTDRTRYVKGAEDAIFDALDWFGLTPDESPRHGGKFGPYRQSDKQKQGIYQQYAEELIQKGYAYHCFCTPERLTQMRKEQQQQKKPPMYDGYCRNIKQEEAQRRAKNESHVIRMNIKSEDKIIKIHDDIRGVIEFQKNLIDDQVLIKSDGFPTYHLAVVIDDHDMQISHVIRGEEWISSTPKHVLLYQYFGWDVPSFLHTPLLRNPDGSKLSKRNNHAAVSWYKEQGFLPDAILNYLANLVFNHPKGEIYSLDEFVRSFTDRTKMHPVGAKFDIAKLEWLNGEYIRRTQISKLKAQIYNFFNEKYSLEMIEKITPLVQERMKTLKEFESLAGFFFDTPKHYEKEINKEWILLMVKSFDDISWDHDTMLEKGRKLAQSHDISFRKLAMDMRIAITGKKVGPPLFESMEILGREECLSRLRAVCQ